VARDGWRLIRSAADDDGTAVLRVDVTRARASPACVRRRIEPGARAARAAGADVDAVDAFELPTVAELAEHVLADAGQRTPTERTGR